MRSRSPRNDLHPVQPVTSKESLLAKIAGRDVHVGVVGLGYVGLPLACAFAEAGFAVIGVDIDDGRRSASSTPGQSYIGDVPSEQVRELLARRPFARHH